MTVTQYFKDELGYVHTFDHTFFCFDPASSAFPLLSCLHRDVVRVLGEDVHHIVLIDASLGLL